MAKKKKGDGKSKGGKGGKTAEAPNIVIEYPPEQGKMSLLYRKASFDVLPGSSNKSAGGMLVERKAHAPLLRYQLEQSHRAVAPGYCEFLRTRKFWMAGDPVPDGAIPKVAAPPKAKGGKGKKKK
mmetsp:Transcript_15127/g.26966  ORF Transcript_15127/g.26966 Transcript_15127/m.26966 type:complete len:125 (+) Transcript_15127:350-724(+)